MKENGKTADLFAAALELKTGERARFLSAECGADAGLRREVEDLLDAFKIAETDGFLQSSALEIEAAHFVAEDADARIGQTLGRYKIVEKIGTGGMGAIYLAVREDGEFQKRAAVKIIKRGMDTEAILRRFRSERQILARLEHPFIARLIDGGTTADGLPYLVMEYVEGVPIDQYCRQNQLSEGKKIELFRAVCAAVAFAHRNLIVHRDLKPSNVLVTKDGEPKLLDFGIAKLLDETEFATQTHLRVLTPAYASPEQSAGATVTTATDVYSLGVVLHELLTGTRPFSTGTASDEQRATNKKLNGELANIIAKALRREPERRYSSVEIFSDDLRRYLEGLPVSARPDTVFYRAGKFVQRNKIVVSAAVIVFLLFVIGAAAIAWQARVAQIERARAERRAENLRKLSNSFAVELHGAIINLPGSLPARRLLLTRAVEQLDALAAESEGNAVLQDDLAQGYYALGEMPAITIAEAEQTYRKAIAIYQKLLEKEPRSIHYRQQLAKGYELLGDLQKVRGNIAESLDFNRQATAILESVSAEDSAPEIRLNLVASYCNAASDLYFMGEAQQSLAYSRKSLALSEELIRLDASDAGYRQRWYDSRSLIVRNLAYLGDYQIAERDLRSLLADYKAQIAKNPNDVSLRYGFWSGQRRLGEILERAGDKTGAVQNLQIALETMENLRQSSSEDVGYQRNTAFSHLSLGQTLVRQQQPEKALPHFRRALELSEKLIAADAERGETTQDLGGIHKGLGEALAMLGNRADGLRHLRQSIEFYRKAAERDRQNAILQAEFAEAQTALADALAKNGNQDEKRAAKEFYQSSLKIWTEMRDKGVLSAADTNRTEEIARALRQFQN